MYIILPENTLKLNIFNTLNMESNNKGNLGLISVIMSIYNGENTIEESVNSILHQSYPYFEFLIIDDGSSDNTFEILKKCLKRDKRIKIFRNNTNLGLTKSLNIIIKKSKGEFIARQDVDDYSHPNRLKKQIEFLNKYKHYSFCGTNGHLRHSKENITWSYTPEAINKNLIVENCFAHSSILIRKSVLIERGFYDEKYEYSQDYELWCRLVYKFKLLSRNLEEHLIIRRIYPKRYLKKISKKFLFQRLNSLKIKFKYLKYTKYKFRGVISIVLFLIELLSFSSVINFIFKKI